MKKTTNYSHSTLSPQAMLMIEQFLSFSVLNSGNKTSPTHINIPYYNNRRGKVRGGLRSVIGKGDPDEIREEIELLLRRDNSAWTSDSQASTPAEKAKKFLVDNHIGIDCSGFAYHVLNAECRARKNGRLRSHISFPGAHGLRKLIANLRPIENTGVVVFADDANSHVISVSDVRPGDIITMVHDAENRVYDHILVIDEVSRDAAGVPKIISYVNSIAWPSDGRYGHGVRRGQIEVGDATLPIEMQKWIEAGRTGPENYTFQRAQRATHTQIRRLFALEK